MGHDTMYRTYSGRWLPTFRGETLFLCSEWRMEVLCYFLTLVSMYQTNLLSIIGASHCNRQYLPVTCHAGAEGH